MFDYHFYTFIRDITMFEKVQSNLFEYPELIALLSLLYPLVNRYGQPE